MENIMEKRKFSRIDYDVEITLEYQGEQFASEILNLSMLGALINTSASPKKDEKVIISFRLSQTGVPITIQCIGKVIRSDKRGLGIEFTEVDLDSFEDLRRIVAFNSGHPELIDEEIAAHIQQQTQSACIK